MNAEQQERDTTFWSSADAIARRLRLHLATLMMVSGVVAAASALTVKALTATVRSDIASTRAEIRALALEQRARAAADSARFERTIEVVELAVVALVEPQGSPDQRDAVDKLRRRRRFTN